MRYTVVVAVFTFFLGTQLVAQEELNQVPASREDVSESTETILRSMEDFKEDSSSEFRRISEDIERNSAEILREERITRTKIENSLAQEALAKRMAEEELKASLANQARIESLERESIEGRTRKMFYIGMSSLLALTVIGFSLVLLRQTKVGNVKTSEIVTSVTSSSTRFHIHEKTDFHSLRRFVEDNETLSILYKSNGKVEVPCVLEIPKKGTEFDGRTLNCTVFLGKDSGSTTVSFDDEPDKGSTWKNRISRAVEILKSQKTA